MKQRLLLIAAAAGFLGCAPANAQVLAADMLPPYEIATIVRSMGLTPRERPRWRNGRYVMGATDRSGREVRVVVDAYSGQVIRVRPLDVGYYEGPRGDGVRPDPYDPRYAAPPPRSIPNGPGYGPGSQPQPGYAPPQQPGYEDDDDYYDGRTGSIAPVPPASQSQPRVTTPKVSTGPSSRSASIAPTKSPETTPLPRPKPDVTQSASKKAEPPPVPQGEIRKIEITKPDPAPKAPETKASEVKAPETKAPETKAPETKAPEVKKDDSKTGTIEVPVTPML